MMSKSRKKRFRSANKYAIPLMMALCCPILSAQPAMEQYTRVWILEGQGRLDEAIASAKQLLEQAPSFYRAYDRLAESYRQKKALPDGELYLRQRLAAEPNNAYIHYGLGRMAEAADRFEEAAEHYAACFAKEPHATACVTAFVSRGWQRLDESTLRSRLGLGREDAYACPAYVQLLRAQRKMEAARRAAHSCLEQAKATGDLDLLMEAHEQARAAVDMSNDGWPAGLSHSRAKLELARRLGDRQMEFSVLNEVVLGLVRLGDVPAAVNLCDEVEKGGFHSITPQSRAYFLLTCYSARGDSDATLKYMWEAQRIEGLSEAGLLQTSYVRSGAFTGSAATSMKPGVYLNERLR
jgi:tetratricopeptide (TPR) repeat protein